MGDRARRLYWDTSVFLCFLNRDEEARRLICEDILHHAQAGNVEIVTSMYTIVEVIRPKGVKHPYLLSDDEVRVLEGMFRWPWISKIQVHEELALNASRLARQCGLRPTDAIHAATAVQERVDELQHWDYDFTKVSTLIQVTEPTYLSQHTLLHPDRIGPAPEDFRALPNGAEPLVGQSPDGAQPSAPPPVPSLPEAPRAAPEPPQRGSSLAVPPPPRSDQ